MKSFKSLLSEVAQPKPEEEKRFKAQHAVEVKPHPVAPESQHKGVMKPKAKRRADQEGDANYDAAYVVKENAEDDMPASPDEASMAMKQAEFIMYVGREIGEHIKGKKEFPEWMQNKLSAVHQAAKDLHATLGAHGGDDMDEELSPKQKKIDHNKNGRIDGQDLAMLRAKKKNEEVELDEISQDTLKGYHAKAAADLRKKKDQLMRGALTTKDLKKGQNRVTGLNRAANKMEEVEESYNWKVSHAGKDVHVKAPHAGAAVKKAQKGFGNMDLTKAKIKNLGKVGAPTNEEVELEETTMSATKKPVNVTGPDGKTRTVMRTTKQKQTTEYGQDKIKTNEEVELEEAIKPGILKFQDKTSVVVKKEDADAINKVMKNMSANSRKKMEQTAMKDKKGFAEILGFAKEAS